MQISFELPARFAFGNVPMRFTIAPVTFKTGIEAIAKAAELFEETECGLCKSKAIRFQVRTTKNGGKFFEMRCAACPAQLDLGTAKSADDHNIWVKRWNKETSSPLPNRGWHIWQKDDGTSTGGQGDAAEGPGNGGDDPINSVPF